MIDIEFVGAAQTVTGSKHLLRTSRASVLLDCGFFQGRRRESVERNRTLGGQGRRVRVNNPAPQPYPPPFGLARRLGRWHDRASIR